MENKEFIKKLKERLEDELGVEREYDCQVNFIIDELAGKELK